jgi:surfeit locus 1 family protein
MSRIPILPTLVVGAAVALMILLGVWQLRRADEKAQLLTRYASASALPEMAFPFAPTTDDPLFRKAGGMCLEPLNPRVEAGYSATGRSGWRHLVDCRTGIEGPGMTVDIGWSQDFAANTNWKGGDVSGIISRQVDHSSLLGRMVSRAGPSPVMLVAAKPAPGLELSAPPRLGDIPNNHLAYAVQWFIFAAIAALIYGLAVWRRIRAQTLP